MPLLRNLKQPMKADKLLSEIYSIDADTDCYMIEIGLKQYADIFSGWDPAPFKRREIDPELKLYLEGSSDEVPLRYPIELCFTLPAGIHDEQKEEETRKGLKNGFSFKLYLIKKELKQINAQILRFVLLGFVCLWTAANSAERATNIGFLPTLIEGLSITGWVFLWEAVSLFAFTNRELYQHYQTYKRLQNAPVIFREA